MGRLGYPLGPEDRKVIKELIRRELPDLVLDAIWNDFFYYFTWFEPDGLTNGWGGSADGTGTVDIDFQRVALQTGTTSGDVTSIGKEPLYHDVMAWDRPQRFRTAFSLSSVADIIFRAVIGVEGTGEHYGFKVIDNKLYGTVGSGSAQTTKELKTIVANTTYLIEARLDIPAGQALFYVDARYVANITTNLPPTLTLHDKFTKIECETATTAAKTASISFFEFIQKRIADQNTN